MESENFNSVIEEIYAEFGETPIYFTAFLRGHVFFEGHTECGDIISLSFTGDLKYVMNLYLEVGAKTTINKLINPYKFRITSFYVWSDINKLINEYNF